MDGQSQIILCGTASHEGRYIFATTLINKGCNVGMVAELIGYGSIEMT